MNLIFYSREDDETSRRIMEYLRSEMEGERVLVCRTAEQILKMLFHSTYEALVAVLLISDKEDLENILSIEDALRTIKIILILPDTRGEIMSRAHVLKPRFLAQRDESLGEVAAVIEKMKTSKTEDRRKGGKCRMKGCPGEAGSEGKCRASAE